VIFGLKICHLATLVRQLCKKYLSKVKPLPASYPIILARQEEDCVADLHQTQTEITVTADQGDQIGRIFAECNFFILGQDLHNLHN
jgi:hypothetical protein